MNKIQRLPDLAQALRDGRNVSLSRNGKWHVRQGLVGGFQKLLGLNENRCMAFAKSFLRALDDLEAVPVRLNSTQPADFKGHLEVGEAFLPVLSRLATPQAQELALRLQDRMIALKYRLEGLDGGLDAANVDPFLVDQLSQQAAEWKQQQTAFYGTNLEDSDLRRLQEASRFPAFVAELVADASLREAFFQWIIRDRVDVPVFIQYPALRERLMNVYLTSRIGRFGGNLLRIQHVAQEGVTRKIVTLPFEGQDVNILDVQRAVTFRGNYRMTIEQAFRVFGAKMQRVGDLEFLGNGINNWNAHLLAWWDADAKEYHELDLNRAAWWKELPVLEKLSHEEAKARFGEHLDGQQWTLAVNATRTTRTLNPDASHAFVEMVVPMTNGDYGVYALGKFATTYAGSLFDSLKLFTATLRATVAYPDENIFYTHREHARRVFPLTVSEGMGFMESIRKDIIKARNGSFTYQIESENCAKWIQDKMEEQFGKERVGNLFRIDMLDTEPPGAAAGVFAMLRLLPRNLHSPVLSFLHYLIGAWRGIWVEENGERVWVSVTTTQFWKDKVCYLPAMMHEAQQPLSVEPVPATVPVTSPDSALVYSEQHIAA